MTHTLQKHAVLLGERDAWDEYLSATKLIEGDLYAEIEPWAWAQLKVQLAALGKDLHE